jgi:hypothetical protein
MPELTCHANCRDGQDRQQPCGPIRYLDDAEPCGHDDKAPGSITKIDIEPCSVICAYKAIRPWRLVRHNNAESAPKGNSKLAKLERDDSIADRIRDCMNHIKPS